jgi:hypothetical protein
VTTFSAALTLGAGATAVLAEATTVGAGAIAIGEGATLTLENTTTLSGIVSGKGALTLNRTAGTAITAAFASTGADTFRVGGAGAVSTDKETNIVKLLGGFNTVTYSGSTAIPADVGTALVSTKTLKTTGTISSQTTLTLGGGTLSIEDNAITWGGDTVLGGTGLITTSVAAGLDLDAATAVLPNTIKLKTTDVGTIAIATTKSTVLNSVLVANDGGTGKFTGSGALDTLETGGLTIPAGTVVDYSAEASATIANGNFKVAVNGTLKVNAAATFAAVAGAGGITIGDKGVLDIGAGTSFAPNGEALSIVSVGTGKLVTTAVAGLKAALAKAGTESLLNVELGGTASLDANATVKAGTVLTIGASGDLTATGGGNSVLTVTGSVVITEGVLKTAANAADAITFAGGTISGSGIRITGTGVQGAGGIASASGGLTISAASLATADNTKLTLTTAKIEILNNAAAPAAAITLTGEFTAANQTFTFTGGIEVPTIAADGGTNGTLNLSNAALVAIAAPVAITLGRLEIKSGVTGTITLVQGVTITIVGKSANAGIKCDSTDIIGTATVTAEDFVSVGTFNATGADAVITGKTGGGTFTKDTVISH